jgi:hypothetical protein
MIGHPLQHTPPGLAIADLQPVAFQFEGTRLVRTGDSIRANLNESKRLLATVMPEVR